MKKHLNLILIITVIIAFVGRLLLTKSAVHGDLIMQAGWGQWIFLNGSFRGFYENGVWIYGWPNHPPLISYVYGLGFQIHDWINLFLVNFGNFIALNHLGAGHLPWYYQFVNWFGSFKYPESPFLWGQLISLKIIPILSDFILAYLISKMSRKKWLGIVYLLSPFSWYESALWGQNDQLGLIFLLLSFWMLVKNKWSFLSPILMVVSVGLKPTGMIFAPLFMWLAIKNKKLFLNVFVGGIITLLLYCLMVTRISNRDIIAFSLHLQKEMFVKGEWWTWANSFNFWRVITGYLTNYHITFLGLTLKFWGYFIFLAFNVFAFYIDRKRNYQDTLKAMFVIGFSAWLFMVTMHERYLFSAVVIGLILLGKFPKLMWYWILLSIIFWLNMFNGWWVPISWQWLKNILTWGGEFYGTIPRILSIVNIWLFYKMTKIILSHQGSKSLKMIK